MIKVIILIFFIFNVSACDPVSKASSKGDNQKQTVFICMASQSECEISSKFGRFTIQLSGEAFQGKIKTELPFKIQLKLDAANQFHQLKSVSSYLEGKTMFMGKIPVFFETNNNSANLVVAESLLASCSEEVMTWRLWFQIEIATENEVEQQNFFIDFDSQRL
jgi:hypothetical protein